MAKTFLIRTQGTSPMRVSGEPVELHFGVKAFVHEDMDHRGFSVVTELSTGWSIAIGETVEDAIEQANNDLAKLGKESMLEHIERAIKETGRINADTDWKEV